MILILFDMILAITLQNTNTLTCFGFNLSKTICPALLKIHLEGSDINVPGIDRHFLLVWICVGISDSYIFKQKYWKPVKRVYRLWISYQNIKFIFSILESPKQYQHRIYILHNTIRNLRSGFLGFVLVLHTRTCTHIHTIY